MRASNGAFSGVDEHLLARGHSGLEARPGPRRRRGPMKTYLGRRVPRALARRLVDVVLPPTTGVGFGPPTSSNRSSLLHRLNGPVALGGRRDQDGGLSLPVVLRQDAAVARQEVVLQTSR